MRTPACKTCNSTHVVRDAWAYWDTENQHWALYNIFDYAHCEQCENETTLYWIDDEQITSNTASQDTEITD